MKMIISLSVVASLAPIAFFAGLVLSGYWGSSAFAPVSRLESGVQESLRGLEKPQIGLFMDDFYIWGRP